MERSGTNHDHWRKLGLQLGGQAVDLVMVVMNQSGMDHLSVEQVQARCGCFSGCGPGRTRRRQRTLTSRCDPKCLTYSRARGLFAGVDLSGAALTQDKDETRLLYGSSSRSATFSAARFVRLLQAEPFFATVRKYSAQSKETSSNAEPGSATAGK